MDFSYTTDQLALADAVGKCLDRSVPEWPDAAWKDPSELTKRLMPTLGSLGIFGSLVPEAQGGIGLTVADIVPAVVEAGRRISPVPLIESTLAAMILAEKEPGAVAALLAGTVMASIAWDGELILSKGVRPFLSGALFDVGYGGSSRWVVSTVATPDGRRGSIVLDMEAPGVQRRAKTGFDLSYPLCDIVVDDLACVLNAVVWDKTENLRSAGTILYAADLVGLASASLGRATRHLGERKQFGKLLASNQALRHMVADDLVALESGRLAVDYAAWALSADPISVPRAVSVAKSFISCAAVKIVENAIQIHGGMGFTWAHPLHLILRRTLRGAATLGTTAEHQERLTAEFLAENAKTHAIYA